jgi:hypothetical protein
MTFPSAGGLLGKRRLRNAVIGMEKPQIRRVNRKKNSHLGPSVGNDDDIRKKPPTVPIATRKNPVKK